MEKVCLFCNKINEAKSLEHIVPESLGNTEYISERGVVCDICNNKFSKFENIALTNSILAVQRSKNGTKTKKGKPASGKIGEMSIKGSSTFEKGNLTIYGKFKVRKVPFRKDVVEWYLPTFTKQSINPCTKLFLKIALQALYKSKPEIYNKYNFKELKEFVLGINTLEWPILTSSYNLGNMLNMPEESIIEHLEKSHIALKYEEIDNPPSFIFCFKTDSIVFQVNLLGRDLEWAKRLLENDKNTRLYPRFFYTKVGRKVPIDQEF